MTTEQATKFMEACETAGITTYNFSDDIGTRYYNDTENNILTLDEDNDMLINIRKTNHAENMYGDKNLTLYANDIDDIRRAEVHGDYNTIKAFIDAYGLSLTDDQLAILIKIDAKNVQRIPVTGDYSVIYHKLSEEEYNALSEEEKAKYDAKVAEDQKRFGLGKSIAAQITY